MAVPAQAVETKAEYKEAAAPIRSELKETGSIPVNKAFWKKTRSFTARLSAYAGIWRKFL